MKILGCRLGAPACGADGSAEGIGQRRVRVAGRRSRVHSGVGVGAIGVAALSLAACGGGGGGSTPSQSTTPPPPTQYTIGGQVTGLSGTGLVLQDNGGDNLTVSASGPFTFATKLNSGATYSVTVMTQPSGQTCTVASGSGTASANVTNVAVSCTSTSSTVTIGGTVTGLSATRQVVLQDNGGDNLTVTQNGPFTFATALASGTAYTVSVMTQPSGQTCTLTGQTGTAGTTNVSSVAVTCAASVGKFAYTASYTAGMIYAYTINQSNGQLTQVGSPIPDGTHPAAVSLAPNGKFAFSASDNGTEVHAFTIDQTTGGLTEVSHSPFSTGFTTGSAYPDIAVDSNSTHLYLASAGDGKVAGFSIDQTTGGLTPLPTVTAGTNAGGIPAFSPDNTHVYVVDQVQGAAGAVSGYSIDPTSGALTPISGGPFPTGIYPVWIVFTPDGKYAYVSCKGDTSGGNTIWAYSVDPTSGALAPLATPTYQMSETPEDLTIDTTGTHLYVPQGTGTNVGEIRAYTINTDGSLTEVTGSPWPVGIGPIFVDIDPTGRFAYVSSAGTGASGVYGFTIDSTSGALTPISGSPWGTGTEPQFITVDASGQFGYTADTASNTISAFTIDQTSGALSPVSGSPYPTGGSPFFVSISPEALGIRD